MINSVFAAEQLNARNLIESIVSSFYILDYGYIKKVNPDKTVDVVHAKRLKTYKGDSLKPTISKSVEMLTIAGVGFSLSMDYKQGDKVLLLGLKEFIPHVKDVTEATETTRYMHYSRETMKALPLCVFNSDAKVKVVIENGDVDISANGKIKLNGSDKQFVTWAELNSALSSFMTALNQHTHSNGNEGSPTGAPIVPMTLDISSAKTTTILTGG